jgi:hypothetical protein
MALVAIGSFGAGAISAIGPAGIRDLISPGSSGAVIAEGPELPVPGHAVLSYPQAIFELSGVAGPKYLMASIELQVPPEALDHAEMRRAELQAHMQSYFRSLTADDLRGPEGLHAAREAVLHRARRIMGADMVLDVFISEMLLG